jgi:hypothetical protein
MKVKIILLAALAFLISCAHKNEKNYQDLFALRILLEAATKPKPNPAATCQSTLTTMQTCAATAPDFSSSTLTEPILSSTISSGKFFTYADYCNNTLVNEPYKSMSDSLKDCYFKCDTSYWQTRKNLNICSSSFATMFNGNFTDTGTLNCKRNCFTATNNQP